MTGSREFTEQIKRHTNSISPLADAEAKRMIATRLLETREKICSGPVFSATDSMEHKIPTHQGAKFRTAKPALYTGKPPEELKYQQKPLTLLLEAGILERCETLRTARMGSLRKDSGKLQSGSCGGPTRRNIIQLSYELNAANCEGYAQQCVWLLVQWRTWMDTARSSCIKDMCIRLHSPTPGQLSCE